MGYGDEGGGVQMAKALRLKEGQWSVFRSGTREIKVVYAGRLCDWCREYLDGVTLVLDIPRRRSIATAESSPHHLTDKMRMAK